MVYRYISYLDSVRYFKSQPEGRRTTVYHSILVNYLAYARELGFTHAHIWVSPPKQGDDYIFYAHPVRGQSCLTQYACEGLPLVHLHHLWRL